LGRIWPGGLGLPELSFDLVHQRMGEAGFAQLGEIEYHHLFPGGGLFGLRSASVFEIERPGFIDLAKEHERVRAVRVEPDLLRRERNGLIGRVERLSEVFGKDEKTCRAADLVDAGLEVAAP
jgi:hypothetical protein